MSTGTDLRREAILATLTLRTESAPGSNAVVEASVGIWREVVAQLAPVIGARGVDVLFSRALHQTSRAFPWLAIAAEHAGSAAQLASLKARLAGQQSTVAAEASYALLVTFTELLTSLIGESLCERLLGPIWSPSPPHAKI